jgi:hypothetical protein
MARIRASFLSMATLALMAIAPAFAQGQTQTQSTTKPAETSATKKLEDVSKWTQEQWNAAKAKWSEEKVAWADCQKQADNKNLSGRESWSFLYSCMTK